MKIQNLLRKLGCYLLRLSHDPIVGEKWILEMPTEEDGKKIVFGQFSYHELHQITVTHVKGEGSVSPVQTYVVRGKDMTNMLTALYQLYVYPGVNPYTHGKTGSAEKIAVSRLFPSGPYWWSKPGLGRKSSYPKDGAVVYEWRETWVVYDKENSFTDPTLLNIVAIHESLV